MGRFLVRRGLQAVVTVLLATLVVHVAVTVLPGDPVRAMFGFRPPPPEVIDAIRAQYHLDEPYVVQYLLYLQQTLALDLGITLNGQSINALVQDAWASTAWLVAIALVAQFVLGIGAAVVSTLLPHTWTSRTILTLAAVMVAVPVVLSAPTLHHLFTFRFPVLPASPAAGGWHAHVLPVVTLVAVTLGTLVIFLRSELRQSLRAPFARFATASGVRRHRVVGLHALRTALPPVVSYVSSNLGLVVVGVLVIEGTMGLDGLGRLVFDAILAQDRAVVVSVVLLTTIAVILMNLVADVLVAALDPRVRTHVGEA